MNEKIEKKLLLHTCCAPCASGCLPMLDSEHRCPVLYFSNSNLSDHAEYEKRLDAVKKLSEIRRLELRIDPYDHAEWLKAVSVLPDYETAPERGPRCALCFAYSLGRAAKLAEELGLPFATTLTVSPHKNSAVIFGIGKKYPHFEPWDFKKKDGFKKSLEFSKLYQLYRQNYCGCEFSLAQRMQQKTT